MTDVSYIKRPRVGDVVKLRDGGGGLVIASSEVIEIVRSMTERDAAEFVLHARARYGDPWRDRMYVLTVRDRGRLRQVETIDVVGVESD
jgi:hypothetical protein